MIDKNKKEKYLRINIRVIKTTKFLINLFYECSRIFN